MQVTIDMDRSGALNSVQWIKPYQFVIDTAELIPNNCRVKSIFCTWPDPRYASPGLAVYQAKQTVPGG